MTDQQTPAFGTPHQQALLDTVVALYRDDQRATAVLLFGSLARGDWHRYSDIDLDIVFEHDVDAARELERLAGAFAALGDHALVLVHDGDEGDLVLASLSELSVRFHTLDTTSPNIIADLRVLWSRIQPSLIHAAGEANRRRRRPEPPANVLNRCLRYAVGIDIACRRDGYWSAVELLQRVRGHVMEIYAAARGQPRALATWASAPAELDTLLRAMLPGASLASLPGCLDAVLAMLEQHLGALSAGTLELNAGQRELLAAVHARRSAQ